MDCSQLFKFMFSNKCGISDFITPVPAIISKNIDFRGWCRLYAAAEVFILRYCVNRVASEMIIRGHLVVLETVLAIEKKEQEHLSTENELWYHQWSKAHVQWDNLLSRSYIVGITLG